MESLTSQEEMRDQVVYLPEEHPWLEISDGTMDETILYSLDELRIV